MCYTVAKLIQQYIISIILCAKKQAKKHLRLFSFEREKSRQIAENNGLIEIQRGFSLIRQSFIH